MSGLATADRSPFSCRDHRAPSGTDVRTSYEVDRDRIIHSAIFRELQHKTQVQSLLISSEPASFRTRLNHVIEVAQIARGLAKEIGADEALSEAIALAHDLGHPPFGHAGERALRRALVDHGRDEWNANIHSLVVVDRVECMFIEFRGLDLTWATREGIARHSTPFDSPISFGEFAETPNGGLECQIVDVADILAYLSHDLDDAIAGRYIDIDSLGAGSPLLGELAAVPAAEWERAAWPEAEFETLRRKRLIAKLIGRVIRDIANNAKAQAEAAGLTTAEDVREHPKRIVVPTHPYEETTRSLLAILTEQYYRSADVRMADARAQDLVRGLFDALLEGRPAALPERFRTGDEVSDVATYIASLNDSTAVALAAAYGVGEAEEIDLHHRTVAGERDGGSSGGASASAPA